MEFVIEIRVTTPEGMGPDDIKHVREAVDWNVLTTLDRLRRCVPHSVKVDDARLSPVRPRE